MDDKLDELARLEDEIKVGGGEKRIKQQHDSGKLMARERVDLLFDPDTFEELDVFVRHHCSNFGMDKTFIPADGVVTGFGKVNGRTVCVFSQDFTARGGTLGEMHAKKICKVMDMAMSIKVPMVGFIDSGGARIQEGINALDGYGHIFFRNSCASGVIPQISAIMGPAAGGAVYSPAMTDFIFMVKKTSRMYITGPDVVKAATGEVVTAEELGGADVHSRISGVTDHVADDDAHALDLARRAVGHLNRVKDVRLDVRDTVDPVCDPADLYGIIPADRRMPFDVREIIARIVDGSAFDEFKRRYGETIVCGFARIYGIPVGIIANNGILFSESALKATHFIELCSQRGIPLVFLQNISGFMVGKQAEAGGIAKDGAKMVSAVACARVPKFTVVIGGSFGAGNYSMCGRAYGPRFLWMWPNARISVMGGNQAAAVLATVKREGIEAKGETWSTEDEAAFKQPILDQYETQGHPFYASARLWDDGIIDPTDTRQVLGQGLEASLNAPIEKTSFGVFRM